MTGPRCWLLFVAGCGGGNLAALEQPSLTAQDVGGVLSLRIGFANHGCPTVDGAHASLGGLPMAATSLGGRAGGLLGGCNAIQFTGVPPTGTSDAVFEVADDSATFSMTAPGYFGARSLSLLSPLVLHPGDAVQARAQPSTDTFDASPGPSVELTLDGGCSAFVLKGAQFQVTGATFSFTVPPSNCPLPAGGVAGMLAVQPGLTLSQVATCAGPVNCSAALQTSYAAPVVVAP